MSIRNDREDVEGRGWESNRFEFEYVSRLLVNSVSTAHSLGCQRESRNGSPKPDFARGPIIMALYAITREFLRRGWLSPPGRKEMG